MAKKSVEGKKDGPSWLETLQNPRGLAIKKFMAQTLGNRFPPHDDLISRLTTCLVTDGDMVGFSKLVNDIYEIGFAKAVSEYREQLTKMGIQVTIKKNQADNQ